MAADSTKQRIWHDIAEAAQFAPWGGPAALMVYPTLAAGAAALPAQFAPWGGPAALMVPITPGSRAVRRELRQQRALRR